MTAVDKMQQLSHMMLATASCHAEGIVDLLVEEHERLKLIANGYINSALPTPSNG